MQIEQRISCGNCGNDMTGIQLQEGETWECGCGPKGAKLGPVTTDKMFGGFINASSHPAPSKQIEQTLNAGTLTATQLIEALQAQIAVRGDLPVLFQTMVGCYPVQEVRPRNPDETGPRIEIYGDWE